MSQFSLPKRSEAQKARLYTTLGHLCPLDPSESSAFPKVEVNSAVCCLIIRQKQTKELYSFKTFFNILTLMFRKLAVNRQMFTATGPPASCSATYQDLLPLYKLLSTHQSFGSLPQIYLIQKRNL